MLVSLTLAHNVGEKIRGALASVVPYVDQCLVFDTGITDDTLTVARSVARDKLVVVSFPWVDDFSKARNYALHEAARRGATRAVMIDSDQRIDWNGHPPDSVPEVDAPPCWRMRYRGNSFAKEQIFTLPTSRYYSGTTHEAFPAGDCPEWPHSRVWESDKSPEECAIKFERDVRLLSAATQRDPKDARAWYYLGQSLQLLKRWADAQDAFAACVRETAWDEEAGWSSYQSACCALERGNLRHGLELCAAGLQHHAAMAELPWLAGVISFRLGQFQQSVRWAEIAASMPRCGRIGFSLPFARWEGPYNVMHHAYLALSNADRAAWAEAETEKMRTARLTANDGS